MWFKQFRQRRTLFSFFTDYHFGSITHLPKNLATEGATATVSLVPVPSLDKGGGLCQEGNPG